MFLSSLRLTNFRNFPEQRIEVPREGLAIVGDNGQGKTNFLESIYYLEIFRSFRGAADEQLVRFGEEVFRIEGRVEGDQGSQAIAAAYDRRQKRKKVTIDGVETTRLGDSIGRLGVVIFSPSDVGIISGSPSARRRFLDILLSLTERQYLEDLQRYRQILLQRNALLRAGESLALVAAWNDGLIRSGSRIIAARIRWVEARRASYVARVRDISGGSDASLELESSVPLAGGPTEPDISLIETSFSAELERLANREQRRSTSLVGPHRDDLRMKAASGGAGEWVDLRVFGSGGQQRTAAVALRMVEAETLAEKLRSHPVILLDDVFAELDPGRSQRILEWVEMESSAQVILTAPKQGDFELRGGSLPLWRMEQGKLLPF